MKQVTLLSNLRLKPFQLSSDYEKFHYSTQIKNWRKNIKIVPTITYYKAYPRLPIQSLPLIKQPYNALTQAFQDRVSSRNFNKSVPIPFIDFSKILFFTSGIKNNQSENTTRFYPSAGARYPIETYVFIRNVVEIMPALYHYYPRTHVLERLDALNEPELLRCFNQKWIMNASCLLVLTAMFKRTTSKYGDRGYRHILVEAGHMAQNLYLMSTSLKLKCCAIGGYRDSKINELLDIDGAFESVVYVIALGN